MPFDSASESAAATATETLEESKYDASGSSGGPLPPSDSNQQNAEELQEEKNGSSSGNALSQQGGGHSQLDDPQTESISSSTHGKASKEIHSLPDDSSQKSSSIGSRRTHEQTSTPSTSRTSRTSSRSRKHSSMSSSSPSDRRKLYIWRWIYPFLPLSTILHLRQTQRSSFQYFPFICLSKQHLTQDVSIRALRMFYLYWIMPGDESGRDTSGPRILNLALGSDSSSVGTVQQMDPTPSLGSKSSTFGNHFSSMQSMSPSSYSLGQNRQYASSVASSSSSSSAPAAASVVIPDVYHKTNTPDVRMRMLIEVLVERIYALRHSEKRSSKQVSTTEGHAPKQESYSNKEQHNDVPQEDPAPYIHFLEEIIEKDFQRDESLLRILFNRHWLFRFAVIKAAPDRILLNIILKYIPECAPRPICNLVMQRACKYGWLDVAQVILPYADLNDREALALRWCAEYGSREVLQFILSNSQQYFPLSNLNNYALRLACKNGHTSIVHLLLCDSRMRLVCPPRIALSDAIESHHERIVILLLQHVQAREKYMQMMQNTAPHPCGTWNSNFNREKFLQYAFEASCTHGLLSVVEFILQHQFSDLDPSFHSNASFVHACKHGQFEICELLLRDDRVNPSDRDNAAVKYAASMGHLKLLKSLLKDDRVDPLAASHFALRKACKYGKLQVVKTLLQHKLYKNEATLPARILQHAVESDNTELVRLLLKDRKFEGDYSPALRAAKRLGNDEIFTLLNRQRVTLR